ncbi:MAG: Shikimate kinase [Formosa sp. Hel3_A1_48]|nr:MAG: Shikimate kinase [Formosa sp. Hel3_A1_48]
MIVALLGYMGSGKSTIGKKLAALEGYTFLDLDDFIEQQEQLSIADLFEQRGHIEFRKLEIKAVQQICRSYSNLVLALGGGTPCYGNTMTFLNQHPNIFTIYLKASVRTLADRLLLEKAKRPLIAKISDNELSEFIAKHLFERSKFYNQAQWSIAVDERPIDEVVKEIQKELDENNL